MDRFVDRADAGRRLAGRLAGLELVEPVVLALPRGGVPVGFEVATALDAPLDVVVARKVGAPGHPEFGIGAIAEGGARVADAATLKMLGISTTEFDDLAEREQVELERRIAVYRPGRTLPPLPGRDVLVVDDGLATGVTAHAAVLAVRHLDPRRIVLAVPTCAADSAERLAAAADAVEWVIRSDDFVAVGHWFEHFEQTSDREVVALLGRTRRVSVAGPDAG